MIIRGEVTKEKLELIYSTIGQVIKKEECFYSKEEVEELKKDNKNIFLGRRGHEIHL